MVFWNSFKYGVLIAGNLGRPESHWTQHKGGGFVPFLNYFVSNLSSPPFAIIYIHVGSCWSHLFPTLCKVFLELVKALSNFTLLLECGLSCPPSKLRFATPSAGSGESTLLGRKAETIQSPHSERRNHESRPHGSSLETSRSHAHQFDSLFAPLLSAMRITD